MALAEKGSVKLQMDMQWKQKDRENQDWQKNKGENWQERGT